MAKFLNEDVYISVDGHDISDWCFNVEVSSEKERVDVTGFNSTGTKSWLPGSREDMIKFSAMQDFAASGIHDILSDLYVSGATFVVEVRPTSSAVSATNPRCYGNAKLYSYTGLSGGQGERSEIEIELVPADSTGFRWADS